MCRVFFFKQKTAYEMRTSDWSSDVCSSDLAATEAAGGRGHEQISMSASPKLRLFGGFSLSDASGEVAGLTLRKTEALIAFLAAGTSHSQPREVLANLLWSASTQAGALQSLRQACLTLTRNLAAHGLAFVQFSRREGVLADRDRKSTRL